MSLLFSVIRIIPPVGRLRIAANLTVGLFACSWIALVIQKVYICRDDASWQSGPTQGCEKLGRTVAITEICRVSPYTISRKEPNLRFLVSGRGS